MILNVPSDGNAYKILVTPELASDWIKTSPGNRKIRQNTVRLYASDMTAGKWKIGNDAVIFDNKGRVRNAHHRLYAIMLSGVSVTMLVRCGVSEDEIVSLDQGLVRSAVDSLTGFGDNKFGDISNKDTQVIKMVLSPLYTCKNSNEVIGEAIVDHRELLDFVFRDCFSGKKFSAPVFAVFVRAAYNREFWDKLKYAGQYLNDGGDAVERQSMFRLPGSSYLKLLYTYIKENKLNGGGSRAQAYIVTKNCLKFFLEGHDNTRPSLSKNIKQNTEDFFPIPPKPYLCISRSSYSPNFQLLIALRSAAKLYYDGQILTPKQVASDIVSSGGLVRADNPEKIIASWFAKIVKTNENQFEIAGVGYFTPEIYAKTQKRIDKYRFNRTNNIPLEDTQKGIFETSLEELDVISV